MRHQKSGKKRGLSIIIIFMICLVLAYTGHAKEDKKVFLRGLEDQDMRILINGMPAGQMGKINITAFNYHKREGYVINDRVAWNVWSDARNYLSGSDYTLDNNGAQMTCSMPQNIF